MRRLLLLAALAFVLVPATQASAGGSWIAVREVEGAGAPGDPLWGAWAERGATVTMRGSFGRGTQAPPSGGPWAAYLRPQDGGRILTPLAPVTFSQDQGTHGEWVASVTFVVPDVPSGDYWVDVCSEPSCEEGVGDLIGGYFTVVGSPFEMHLLNESRRLEGDIQELRRDLRQMGDLEAKVKDLQSELATARHQLAQAAIEADEERAATEATVAAAHAATNRWRTWTVALALALTIFVSIGGVGLVRMRRRRSPRVPDTVEELLAGSETGDRDDREAPIGRP